MRNRIGLVLSFVLLTGATLGGLAGCSSDYPLDSRKTHIHDMRGEGPGSKR